VSDIRHELAAGWIGQGADVRLDLTGEQLGKLAGECATAVEQGGELEEETLKVEEFLQTIDDDVEEAQKRARCERNTSWSEWQDKAFKGGARGMHRLSKVHPLWQPTTVVVDGKCTALPQAILDAETAKVEKYWSASQRPAAVVVDDRSALPRATPGEIRAAARLFSPTTARSLDGTHPRQYAALPDEGLAALAAIFEASERIGGFPVQLWWLLFPLIEKPKGGMRCILL